MKSKNYLEKTALLTVLAVMLTILLVQSGTPLTVTSNESGYLLWIDAEPKDLTATYNPLFNHTFHTTWESSNNITNVTITHNFTGTNTTKPVQATEPNNYAYTTAGLAAGKYVWSMTAKDTGTNEETTPTFNVTISKKQPLMKLTLSGEEENISLEEGQEVQIHAEILEGEGTIELLINNEIQETSSTNIILNKTLPEGIHSIKLRHNETHNYTHAEMTRQATIHKSELTLQTNKEEYELGEAGFYGASAPANAKVNVTIHGPDWEFLVVRKDEHTSSYPVAEPLYTNKAGTYIVRANMKHGDTIKQKEVLYTVKNSIQIIIQGNKTAKPNEEIQLTAAATKGISPYTYTWTLHDGTQVTGNQLKRKYAQSGDYKIELEAKDKEGNKKTEEIEVSIRNKYKLTVTVKDSQTGTPINNADVIIGGEVKKTGTDGKAELEVIEGLRTLQVYAASYKTHEEDVDMTANKAVTVELEKPIPTSQQATSNQITIISPTNNQQISSRLVTFEVQITTTATTICKIYVAEESSDWYEEIESFSISNTQEIRHTQELAPNTYKWRVECSDQTRTYSSQQITFKVADTATSTTSSNTYDAGNLRMKIEDAQSNLNTLSFEDQKAAQALGIETTIERALRDFDRTLRDINSMMFRRDLTQEQINERVGEYQELLRELERTTPSNIRTFETKTFVDYPRDEKLISVAKEYQEEKNIAGNIRVEELKRLQTKIVVKTEAITAEITYLSGETKQLTIISKEIEYKEAPGRNEFIIEQIPTEIASSAQNIVFLQEVEIVRNNPLIKAGAPTKLTYYVEGHKNIETAEQTTTILLSDSLFTTQRQGNPLTGRVTDIDLDFGTPIWSLIVLILLVLLYLAHAFDLKNKAVELVSGASKKKEHQLRMLINDCQDYLDTDNVERANLVYKELRYNYDSASEAVKKEVYEEAIKLKEAINAKYIAKLTLILEEATKNSEKKTMIDAYNKIVDAYEELEPEARRLVKDRLMKSQRLAQQKFPDAFTA